MDQENFFTLFSIKPHFFINHEDLSNQYHQLMDTFHPDRFVDQTPLEQDIALSMSVKINAAFGVLSSPIKRAKYLLSLLAPTSIVTTENYTDHSTQFLATFMEEHLTLQQNIQSKNKEVLLDMHTQISDKLDNIYQAFDHAIQNHAFDEAKTYLDQAAYYNKMCAQIKPHLA